LRDSTKQVTLSKRITISFCLALSIFLGVFLVQYSGAVHILLSNAATQVDFSSTENGIEAAYTKIQAAQQNGENTTALVEKLNVAIGLFLKAQEENSTNPSQASSDLVNATTIASQVLNSSSTLAQKGAVQKEREMTVATIESASILLVALFIYLYGEWIFEFFWFYQHKDFVVKLKDG
jgi:hypothetical protein